MNNEFCWFEDDGIFDFCFRNLYVCDVFMYYDFEWIVGDFFFNMFDRNCVNIIFNRNKLVLKRFVGFGMCFYGYGYFFVWVFNVDMYVVEFNVFVIVKEKFGCFFMDFFFDFCFVCFEDVCVVLKFFISMKLEYVSYDIKFVYIGIYEFFGCYYFFYFKFFFCYI